MIYSGESLQDGLIVTSLGILQIRGKYYTWSVNVLGMKITDKNYPRSGVWSSLHLLVTEFEIGYLQTLAFGGSVCLT